METGNVYDAFSGLVSRSRHLIDEVSGMDARDRRAVQFAFVWLCAVVGYVVVARTVGWWFCLLPVRFLVGFFIGAKGANSNDVIVPEGIERVDL